MVIVTNHFSLLTSISQLSSSGLSYFSKSVVSPSVVVVPPGLLLTISTVQYLTQEIGYFRETAEVGNTVPEKEGEHTDMRK